MSDAYSILNMDVKKKILKRADVMDAMNLAQNDREINEILRDDIIWKKWFKRDLSIIPPIIPQWFPAEGEFPIWKRYYLWCRLCIGGIQWNIVRRWNNPSILYYNLNSVTDGSFQRLFESIERLPYTVDIICSSFITPMESIDFRRFITSNFRDMAYNTNSIEIDRISNTLMLVKWVLRDVKLGQCVKRSDETALFESSPRIFQYDEKKLLVACSVCESAESTHRCSSCDKPYCSIECAQRDWDNYNCI
jgi:hypothetical protein